MSLPHGWRREEVIRKNGLSAGKIDVYYYSPDGRKFRSKNQLSKVLKDRVDFSNFDYKTGKNISNSNLYNKSKFDNNLSLPIRQTASIFKQPVTVVKNHHDSKTRTDLKHGYLQEQPRQLFWEKRLQSLQASDITGNSLPHIHLPSIIQGMVPELIGTDSLLHSIAASLHLGSNAINGQGTPANIIQKNPCARINADQPLMHSVCITDNDIQRQEMKVNDARRRLQQAMNSVILSSA